MNRAKANLFLDYGELIFHYDFNKKTLLRAHKLALNHINDMLANQLEKLNL